MQSYLRNLFAFCSISLLFCFGNAFGGSGQNSDILSARPAVFRIFDRDKNETTSKMPRRSCQYNEMKSTLYR